MSDRMKVGAGGAVVIAAVLLFVALQDTGSDSESGSSSGRPSKKVTTEEKPTPPPIPVIRLKGGEPVGGIEEVEATGGERVRFRVSSDTEGEVHVHGYEITRAVARGGSVTLDFPADLEGGYEVELHHGGGESQIADLRVQPG